MKSDCSMSDNEEKLNQSELARALGVSRQAIHKLIAAGKLMPDEYGKMTMTEARQAIALCLHPASKCAKNAKNSGSFEEEPVLNHSAISELPGDFGQARFLTEIETWQLKRIEREKKQAQLIEVQWVERVAANAFNNTRSALLQLPARLASVLAVETNAAKVHALLHDEICQALAQIANAPDLMQKLAHQYADV